MTLLLPKFEVIDGAEVWSPLVGNRVKDELRIRRTRPAGLDLSSVGDVGPTDRRVAIRPVCLEGSDGFVSSPRRFDSFRLERPSCRARITLAEDQHITRFTAHTMPVPRSTPRSSWTLRVG